jgi:hypothetical protein
MTEFRLGFGEAIIIGDIPRKLEDFIISSNKLGVLNNKTLVSEIYEQLIFTEDEVLIKGYWAGYICEKGGWYKREFVNWQILAFELWEELSRGEHQLKILVKDIEFELNTDQPKDRNDKNVIQQIKYYKRLHRTPRGDCPYFKNETLDKHSQLCCICGKNNITLLRRKK